ncbi:MAG: Nramp family divalent metal transporter, partial [Chloroflexota bacterium]
MIEQSSQSKESRTGIDPWSVADLPPALPLRGLNALGAIGPGIIILGVSIGSGEWLLGPAAFVKYGLALLWVATVAILLQTIFNTEVIRYTLYTGEPIFTGFMRTKPGVNFWGIFYAILFFLQVGWPVWAGAAATAIFYLFLGRLPRATDGTIVYAIGVGTFLLCVAILLFGRRIERTLETFNWILVLLIVTGLAALCVILAPPAQWASVLLGLIGFDTRTRAFDLFPAGADWFLIGAFAAYSGAGGMVNLMIASWARDKGYGMGRVVGFIPAAIGGQKVR